MTSKPRTIHILEDEPGGRLDRLLAARVAELSRTRLKALIEAGSVAVDGRTIRDPGHRVNSGAAIVVDVPERPGQARRRAIPLNVVFEDDDIIGIDKPKGLVVHPAAGHWKGTLVNALIAHCGASLSGIGGERRPGIVHRLDKDTSGLMVVAKNDRAHERLAAPLPATATRAAHSNAAIWPSSGARRIARAAPSTGRSTGTRSRATAWRSARMAAKRSLTGRFWSAMAPAKPVGAPARRGNRLRASSPAGWKPGAPIESRCIWPRSGIRCWGMVSTDQGFAPRRPSCRLPAQSALRLLAGRPCIPIYCRSNTPLPVRFTVSLGTAALSRAFARGAGSHSE